MKPNEKIQGYVSTAQGGECRDASLEWPQCRSVALPLCPPGAKGKMLSLGSGLCWCTRGGSEEVCEL